MCVLRNIILLERRSLQKYLRGRRSPALSHHYTRVKHVCNGKAIIEFLLYRPTVVGRRIMNRCSCTVEGSDSSIIVSISCSYADGQYEWLHVLMYVFVRLLLQLVWRPSCNLLINVNPVNLCEQLYEISIQTEDQLAKLAAGVAKQEARCDCERSPLKLKIKNLRLL